MRCYNDHEGKKISPLPLPHRITWPVSPVARVSGFSGGRGGGKRARGKGMLLPLPSPSPPPPLPTPLRKASYSQVTYFRFRLTCFHAEKPKPSLNFTRISIDQGHTTGKNKQNLKTMPFPVYPTRFVGLYDRGIFDQTIIV